MEKTTALCTIFLILAACGGGGDTIRLPSGPAEYTALFQESLTIAEIADSYEGLSGDLPESGTSTYTGTIFLAPASAGAGTGYTGAVSLEANFAGSGALSGSASTFYEGSFDAAGNATSAGTLKTGTLHLSSSSLSTGLFDIAVSGSLAVQGTSPRTAAGTLDGRFAGAGGLNPDVIVGKGTVAFSGAGDYDAFLLAN